MARIRSVFCLTAILATVSLCFAGDKADDKLEGWLASPRPDLEIRLFPALGMRIIAAVDAVHNVTQRGNARQFILSAAAERT